MALRPPPTADLSQGHETYSATTSIIWAIVSGPSKTQPLSDLSDLKELEMQQKGGTAETQTTAVLERVQGQAGAWRREDLAHPQVTRRKGGPCREAKPGQMVP